MVLTLADSLLQGLLRMKLSTSFQNFTNSNSERIDVINVRVIKASADLFAAPPSSICYHSFSTGSVPNKLKIRKVLPIYKSDDNKANFTNYRPISI